MTEWSLRADGMAKIKGVASSCSWSGTGGCIASSSAPSEGGVHGCVCVCVGEIVQK